MTTHYETIGVAETATDEEIKRAYKSLAKKHHPDLNPNNRAEAEEKFKQINQAYDAIKDAQSRQRYDMERRNPGGQQGFGGFNRSNFHFTDLGGQDGFEIFGDPIFTHIFGGHNRRMHRNNDIHLRYHVTLADVITGKETDFSVDVDGQNKSIKIKIPPGVDTGTQLRAQGQGSQAIKGAPPGDLIVIIDVLPHHKFRREGQHIILDLTVDVMDLILGTNVEIETLEGKKMKVTIPELTDIGKTLRLPGKGLPVLNSPNTMGDLYIRLIGKMPPGLSEMSRDKLKEAKELINQHRNFDSYS